MPWDRSYSSRLLLGSPRRRMPIAREQLARLSERVLEHGPAHRTFEVQADELLEPSETFEHALTLRAEDDDLAALARSAVALVRTRRVHGPGHHDAHSSTFIAPSPRRPRAPARSPEAQRACSSG